MFFSSQHAPTILPPVLVPSLHPTNKSSQPDIPFFAARPCFPISLGDTKNPSNRSPSHAHINHQELYSSTRTSSFRMAPSKEKQRKQDGKKQRDRESKGEGEGEEDMLQFSAVAPSDTELIFFLFNHQQRRANAAAISNRVKSNPAAFSKFRNLCNSPDFEQTMRAAALKPNSNQG
uniref:Uncharacterized protein n=1 Tax=Grammatophora oceanica TaxID=210454 RepID=A0A7S1Y1W6_9STRA|mmetsp:Transcript_16328/g.24156  ORF Transcript_16328/g.24156 Transcript_16328/m.24156 type:complete len:176 (+) Transcript_16328:238-765(+)